MKLFVSNLTDRLRTGRNIQNLQNYVKGGHVGVVTHFWNFGTPNIWGMVEARNFKFGTEMDGSEY